MKNHDDIKKIYTQVDYAVNSLPYIEDEKSRKNTAIYVTQNTKHLLEDRDLKSKKLAARALGFVEPYIGEEDLFTLRLLESEEAFIKILQSHNEQAFFDVVAPLAKNAHSETSQSLSLAVKLLKPVLEDDALYDNAFDAYYLLSKTIKLYDCSPDEKTGLFKKSIEKSFDAIQKEKTTEKLFDVLVGKAIVIENSGKVEDMLSQKIIEVGDDLYMASRSFAMRAKIAQKISSNYKVLAKSNSNNKRNVDFLLHLSNLAMLSESGGEAETAIISDIISIADYTMTMAVSNEDFHHYMNGINETCNVILTSSTISDENKKRIENLQSPSNEYDMLVNNAMSMKTAKNQAIRQTFSENIISKTEKILDNPNTPPSILYKMYENFGDMASEEKNSKIKKTFEGIIQKIDKKFEGMSI